MDSAVLKPLSEPQALQQAVLKTGASLTDTEVSAGPHRKETCSLTSAAGDDGIQPGPLGDGQPHNLFCNRGVAAQSTAHLFKRYATPVTKTTR